MLTSTAVSASNVLLVTFEAEGAGAGAALMSTCRARKYNDTTVILEQIWQSSHYSSCGSLSAPLDGKSPWEYLLQGLPQLHTHASHRSSKSRDTHSRSAVMKSAHAKRIGEPEGQRRMPVNKSCQGVWLR